MAVSVDASVCPALMDGYFQATIRFVATDTLPEAAHLCLCIPTPDGPVPLISLFLQNGTIQTKVEQSVQRPRRVGLFWPTQQMEITVLLQVRPNTPLHIQVEGHTLPPICTTFRTTRHPLPALPHASALVWEINLPQPTERLPVAVRRAKVVRSIYA